MTTPKYTRSMHCNVGEACAVALLDMSGSNAISRVGGGVPSANPARPTQVIKNGEWSSLVREVTTEVKRQRAVNEEDDDEEDEAEENTEENFEIRWIDSSASPGWKWGKEMKVGWDRDANLQSCLKGSTGAGGGGGGGGGGGKQRKNSLLQGATSAVSWTIQQDKARRRNSNRARTSAVAKNGSGRGSGDTGRTTEAPPVAPRRKERGEEGEEEGEEEEEEQSASPPVVPAVGCRRDSNSSRHNASEALNDVIASVGMFAIGGGGARSPQSESSRRSENESGGSLGVGVERNPVGSLLKTRSERGTLDRNRSTFGFLTAAKPTGQQVWQANRERELGRAEGLKLGGTGGIGGVSQIHPKSSGRRGGGGGGGGGGGSEGSVKPRAGFGGEKLW